MVGIDPNRSLLTGSLIQDSLILNTAEGKRRYLAQDLKFSVLQKSSLQLAMNRFRGNENGVNDTIMGKMVKGFI